MISQARGRDQELAGGDDGARRAGPGRRGRRERGRATDLDDPRRGHRHVLAGPVDAHLYRRRRRGGAHPAGDVGHQRADDHRRGHQRADRRARIRVHRRGADPDGRPGAGQCPAPGRRRPEGRRARGADPPALGSCRQLRPVPGRRRAGPGRRAALRHRPRSLLPQGLPVAAVGLGDAALSAAQPGHGARRAGPRAGRPAGARARATRPARRRSSWTRRRLVRHRRRRRLDLSQHRRRPAARLPRRCRRLDGLDGPAARQADFLLPSHDYAVFSDGPVTRIGRAHGADRQGAR